MEGNNLEEETIRPILSKKIITSDKVTINLEEELVASSETIKKLLEEDCSEISLPQITNQILAVVIDFCKKNAATSGFYRAAQDEFLDIHRDEILDLVMAADYLKIESLMDLACRGVAGLIKDQTPEAVRDMLGIVNEFTPEEEEEHRRKYSWAFE